MNIQTPENITVGKTAFPYNFNQKLFALQSLMQSGDIHSVYAQLGQCELLICQIIEMLESDKYESQTDYLLQLSKDIKKLINELNSKLLEL